MRIVIVGGGPAGMLASLAAREENQEAEILLLEKNEKLGKKLFLTGKGRGNVTNACALPDFFAHYLSNPRFLYPALQAFSNQDLIKLLERNGCKCKTERGQRVFPQSGKAYTVTDALRRAMKKAGIRILYKTEVRAIDSLHGHPAFLVRAGREDYPADRVIVATGGLSYPSTGATGDGYRFARKAGLRVTECCPSLVPLSVEEPDFLALQGLKLKNVSIVVRDEDGKRYSEGFGEMEFIKEGLSGPLVLSASARVTRYLHAERARRLLSIHIDLKPALTVQQLSQRIQRELDSLRGAPWRLLLPTLLPERLCPVFAKRLQRLGMPGTKKASELSRAEREAIVSLMKDFLFTIRGTGSFREAIVTQGGVSVQDIQPRTMEARAVRGLYFAGEVLDVDGFTGGFNLQAAFSTGYLAGRNAAKA